MIRTGALTTRAAAALLLHLVERRELDRGVAGRAVQLLLHACHQPVDRVRRVGHPRRYLGVLLAAGEIARNAVEDAAVAARLQRLVDHAADVRLHPGVLCRQREADALAPHRDRLLQRLLELALDHAARIGGGHSAHVDARDRDALRDHVIARAVIRVRCDRASAEHQQEDGHQDEPPGPHGGNTPSG
jgi:hypothetical protein